MDDRLFDSFYLYLYPGLTQSHTVRHIILTDGHRIMAILRVPLAVDTKIWGVTLIQIVLLIIKAMYFFSFVILSLGMTSSITFKYDISTDFLDKSFENV